MGVISLKDSKLSILVLTIFSCLLIATSAHGQFAPKSTRGIWSLGPCSNSNDGFFIGRDFAMIYRVRNRAQPTITIGRLVWAGGLSMMYVNNIPTILPVKQTLQTCGALPSSAYASVGEAISLFGALDQIVETCANGNGMRCTRAAFAFADVSDDDRLSLAEVTRVVRALAVFVAYQGIIENRAASSANFSVEVEVNQLMGTSMFVALLGPTLTSNLVTSYDYNGDGFLALDEITQDRIPLFETAPVDGTGQVIGSAAAQAALSAAMKFIVGNMGQIGSSMLGGILR